MDKTIRKGNKWAKVSGKRGSWTVAKGFKSDTEATYINTVANKELALIMANTWVKD